MSGESVSVGVCKVHHALMNIVICVHKNDTQIFVGRFYCYCLSWMLFVVERDDHEFVGLSFLL